MTDSELRSKGNWPAVVLFRASTRESLRARVAEVREGQTASADFSDHFAAPISEAHGDFCLGIVASSPPDLLAKLALASSRLAEPRRGRIKDPSGMYFESEPLGGSGRLAVLFPGEGSQYDSGLADLRSEFPHAGRILSASGITDHGPMADAVSTVLAADLALWQILAELGVPADAFLGHSTGELAALIVSGMMDASTPAGFERFRQDLSHLARLAGGDLPSVAVIAAGTDAATLRGLFSDADHAAYIGMENCPHQTVIVSEIAAASEITTRLTAHGILFERLPFDRPYHTPLFQRFAERLVPLYERWIGAPPVVPTYTCTTAAPFPASVSDARKIAADQWVRPVMFQQTIESMHSDGIRVFVESGMRGNLTAFVGDILRGRPHAAVPANLPNRGSREQLLHLVAQLSAHGMRLKADLLAPQARASSARARGSLRVVETHLKYMSTFFEVQETVMKAYLAQRGRSARVEPELEMGGVLLPGAERMPLLGTIVSRDPGRLVAVRDFSPEEDIYLRDHTFGRELSASDPGLMGLPVLPLTVSIEMMAEAASLLMPGKVLVALVDIRARRWVARPSGRFTLRVEAAIDSSLPDKCVVELFEHGRDLTDLRLKSPVADATVLFASAFPSRPAPEIIRPAGDSPRITREAIYRDTMFHGPAFHGIASALAHPDGRCSADIEILPRNRLFLSNPDPRFVVDPIFLDQVGQVFGVWLTYARDTVPQAFPATIDSIEFFAPLPRPGDVVCCVAGNCAASSKELVGDAEVVASDGLVSVRVRAWRDRRFDFPDAFLQTWSGTSGHSLSHPWGDVARMLPVGVTTEVARVTLDSFPEGFFDQHGGIWFTTLACCVLSARERRELSLLTYPLHRKVQWLLGRIAAKDAVRWYLKNRFGTVVRPADIEIGSGDGGRPVVSGSWAAEPFRIPHISISHTGTTVAAVAGSPEDCGAVGIDVESRNGMNEDVMRAGLSSAELDVVSDIPAENAMDWPLRAWCAKESALKAIGFGAGEAPPALAATAANVLDGIIEISRHGAQHYAGAHALQVATALVNDVCVAVAYLPAPSQMLTEAL